MSNSIRTCFSDCYNTPRVHAKQHPHQLLGLAAVLHIVVLLLHTIYRSAAPASRTRRGTTSSNALYYTRYIVVPHQLLGLAAVLGGERCRRHIEKGCVALCRHGPVMHISYTSHMAGWCVIYDIDR